MRNWLIKLFGGMLIEDVSEIIGLMNGKIDFLKAEIKHLNEALREARKNDHRDSKGRFMKGKDNA